jgi:hypothetical protein
MRYYCCQNSWESMPEEEDEEEDEEEEEEEEEENNLYPACTIYSLLNHIESLCGIATPLALFIIT